MVAGATDVKSDPGWCSATEPLWPLEAAWAQTSPRAQSASRATQIFTVPVAALPLDTNMVTGSSPDRRHLWQQRPRMPTQTPAGVGPQTQTSIWPRVAERPPCQPAPHHLCFFSSASSCSTCTHPPYFSTTDSLIIMVSTQAGLGVSSTHLGHKGNIFLYPDRWSVILLSWHQWKQPYR